MAINRALFKFDGARKAFSAQARYNSRDAFEVCEGSFAALKEVPSLPKPHQRLRQRLIQQGVLRHQGGKLVFTKNQEFNSRSEAACVVCACSRNGWDAWKEVV
jgi:uncharacterized protein DUF4357